MNVTRDSQGHIDQAAIEASATRSDMREWLRARLAGQDRFLPLDGQDMEAPNEVFVEVWQEAEPRGLVRETLGLACSDLLREAWEMGAPGIWTEGLLDLLAIIRPETCQALLSQTAARPDFPDAWRQANLDLAWLRATAAYPRQEPRLGAVWERLLQDRRCAAIAFSALAQDPWSAAMHLPTYYHGLRPHERGVVVRKAVAAMFRSDPREARESLEWYWADLGLEAGLQEAVNAALATLRLPAPAGQRSRAGQAPGRAAEPEIEGSFLDGIAAEPAYQDVAA